MEETPGQKWRREMDELKAKKKASGLTKEEEDKLEYMQDRWDDWASDIEFSY